LKLLKHLSGAASHVADRLGDDVILAQCAKNLLSLPSRFFNMPARILDEIFPIDVKSSVGHEPSVTCAGKTKKRISARGFTWIRTL
jgi:hypothetical protein